MSGMLRQKSKHIDDSSKENDLLALRVKASSEKSDDLSSSCHLGHPNVFCSCLKSFIFICMVVCLALLVPGVIYCFINDADIVDEHYDLSGLQDLLPADKLSIRVTCPENIKQLQEFVAHYSICPHVLEIGVVATPSCQSLEGVNFQYLKAHAPVRLVHEDGTSAAPWAIGEGLLLLDSDVFITCDAMRYTHSVWRSASTTMAGFFPRLHTRTVISVGGEATKQQHFRSKAPYQYYGWWFVWWHSRYSLVHSAGLEMHRDIWQAYLADPLPQQLLTHNPNCGNILPSFWYSLHHNTPFVWVDVDVEMRYAALNAMAKHDASAKSKTESTSHAGSVDVGVHRKMSTAGDSTSTTTGMSSSGSASSVATGMSWLNWLLPSSQSQSNLGHDVEYSQCLNAYAGLVASSQSEKAAAVSVGDGERGSSPVLYSTYKATAARELLCW